MAQNFDTISQTDRLKESDSFLVGQTNSDYSSELQNIKKITDPGFRLLVFYGTPMGINGLWDIEQAAQEFTYWDYIVLGDGYEDPGHGEYSNTVDIISKIKDAKPHTRIFGYVGVGVTTGNLSEAQMQTKIDNWETAGATDIFLDEMGYDFEVSRSRQNNIIDYVHSKEMNAMINAWDPDDVFSSAVEATYNPSGTATTAQSGDLYMSEHFIVNTYEYSSNNGYKTQYEFKTKEDKVINYTKTLGILPVAIDIVENSYSKAEREKYWEVAQAFSLIYGKKAYGLQMYEFSANAPGTDIAYKETFVDKDYFKDFYTTHVNYFLDGAWETWRRTQSGRVVQGYIKDTTGPYYGIITNSNERNIVVEITDATDKTEILGDATIANSPVMIQRTGSGSGKLIVQCSGTNVVRHKGLEVSSLEFEIEDSGVELYPSGGYWYVKSTIGCELWNVNSTIEAVYEKFLSGTLDSDSSSGVIHNIDNIDKIVSTNIMAWNSTDSYYGIADIYNSASSSYAIIYRISETTVDFGAVGSVYQGNAYRVSIKYYI